MKEVFWISQCTHIFLLHIFRNLNVKDEKKETITVVFHAILSDKFKLDDVTKIVIRGEDPVFEGWDKGGIVLEKERQVATSYIRMKIQQND